MPMINYACECGHSAKKIFRRAEGITSTILCEKCGKEMTKLLSAPTQSSKISIDNGVQARRVEVSPDIIEVMEERSKKNYREE